jgi:hypothetical protein
MILKLITDEIASNNPKLTFTERSHQQTFCFHLGIPYCALTLKNDTLHMHHRNHTTTLHLCDPDLIPKLTKLLHDKAPRLEITFPSAK